MYYYREHMHAQHMTVCMHMLVVLSVRDNETEDLYVYSMYNQIRCTYNDEDKSRQRKAKAVESNNHQPQQL